MKALLLWIKEVFSHKSFILSNIILLVSITIFTFAFTLFRSITVSTDNVIRTLLTGDYLITADESVAVNIEKTLDKEHIPYNKAIFEAALFKTKTESIPLQLRIVDFSFFTPWRKKLLGIKGEMQQGLYLAEKYKSDGVLMREGEKRGKLYKDPCTYKSGFALIDENIAFLVVEDIDAFESSTTSFIVNASDEGKNKTFDVVYGIYRNFDAPYYTPELLVENFYSSLSASWSSFYFISMMFVILSSLYAISISLSFKKDNAMLLRTFEIYGVPYYHLYLYSLLSVLLTILFFIVLGFLFGLLLTALFPSFAHLFSSLFNLDVSYYFLSFSPSIPFLSLLKVYLFEIVLSLFISSLTFLFSFTRRRAIWR